MAINTKNIVAFFALFGVIQSIRHTMYFPNAKQLVRVVRSGHDSQFTTTNVPILTTEVNCFLELPEEGDQKYDEGDSGMVTDESESQSEEHEKEKIDDDFISRFSEHFLTCNHIEIDQGSYDVLLNESVYVPIYSMVFNDSDYLIKGDKLYICPREPDDGIRMDSSGNSSEQEDYTNRTIDDDLLSRFSDRFLNCTHSVVIERGCYDVLSNRSVHVPIYGMVFNESDYNIKDDQLYVCPDFFGNPKPHKFHHTSVIISQVGLAISMIFILLYLFFFLIIETLRNLPGYCLTSLCISLLVAYLCFFLPGTHETYQQCQAIGISIFYFFLASFFWMNVLSFDVWRSLRMATTKLRLSGSKVMWTRFAMYSIYAWGFPINLVIVAMTVTSNENVGENYRMIFHPVNCWFLYKQALFVYFALPLFIILCMNSFFFGSSFYMITRASMKTAENRAVLWNRFMVSLRLAVAMGLTWCFGVLATATQSQVLFYFFTIFNTLQGAFIFFGFGFGVKTRKALEKKFQSRKTSTCPTQISSQHGQSVTSV